MVDTVLLYLNRARLHVKTNLDHLVPASALSSWLSIGFLNGFCQENGVFYSLNICHETTGLTIFMPFQHSLLISGPVLKLSRCISIYVYELTPASF